MKEPKKMSMLMYQVWKPSDLFLKVLLPSCIFIPYEYYVRVFFSTLVDHMDQPALECRRSQQLQKL